ncbi:hypothetical protein ACET3Z_029594 [Daucus carota]
MILISSLLFLLISINSKQMKSMKVHPLSTKRNTTFLGNRDSPIDQTAPRKLRRLPHVFGKVLELPFPSDADVAVDESPNSINFVAGIENSDFSGAGKSVRAHAVEIYPGITKVVVVRDGKVGDLVGEKIGVDVWRCRLPAAALTGLATAAIVDGELVVTVPKSRGF